MGTSALQAATPRHPGGSEGAVVVAFDGRSGNVTLQASDITSLGGELLPTAPSVFGKTLYADGAGGAFWGTAGAGAVGSFMGRTGVVTLQASDITSLGGDLLPPPPSVFGKTLFADGSGGAFWADPASGSGGLTSFQGRTTAAAVLTSGDITGLGGELLPAPPSVFGKMLYADGSGGTFWADAPAGGGSGGVASFMSRTGAVTLQASDITSLGGVLVPNPASVPFGKQLTADGTGGTFWG